MTNTNAQRAKVFHGTLEKTSGGLTKKDLVKNSNGKIVSKKASVAAKKNNNLGAFKKIKILKFLNQTVNLVKNQTVNLVKKNQTVNLVKKNQIKNK